MSVYGQFEGQDVEKVSASMTGKMTLAKRLGMGDELVIIARVRTTKVTHEAKHGLERKHVLDAGDAVYELTPDVLERVLDMGGLASPDALVDAAQTRIDDLLDEREGRRKLPLSVEGAAAELFDEVTEAQRAEAARYEKDDDDDDDAA